MSVAPEGRPFIGLAAIILAALLVVAELAGGGWWLALPVAWLPIALWVPWFFRDPVREGPRGDHLIIAPADGKVVSVIEIDEPTFVGGRAVRVSVFMNVFNVHVNRHPVNGVVEHRAYRPGKFFNASLDKASADNEQASLGIGTARGPVLVRQIAGLVARRIVTDPEVGAAVRQGERLGMIRFGSRLDTFFRPDAVPSVRVGDRTRAGVTVIGEWPA
ncbi:MAG TPA: phosphatidylserine decarboxylase family protein [Gemmatimonadales bacterium]|nr:phosphatidylserine decarboxylase family protein [Gemmatimonadales bacterium]